MIAALKNEAKSIGLATVGVAPAIGEVRQEFDWARSVVCVAVSYLPPERPTDDRPRGLVARIARGADYHIVLREKLSRLAETILEKHPAARLEVCADTSPLPERRLALLAGIGWRGKNGCVFVDGCGSWVALGEIVTDVTLEHSVEPTPLEDRCGDCTRCVDWCPTGAIVRPHEIDCSRCLSAVTQAGGSIHVDLRHAIGNRIYGCDICQEVCPQNAGIQPIAAEFATESFPGADPELIPLITLSRHEFSGSVRHSSIGWIRRNRIRRNAALAAGNLRCGDSLPVLSEMRSDENPVLREAAEWAIKEIKQDLSKKQ